MNRIITVIAIAGLMTGCASNKHWTKASVTQEQASQDWAACELVAAQIARAEVGGAQTYSGPVRQQMYHSGRISNGYNTYNYSGNSYTQGASQSEVAGYNAGASFGNGFAYGMAQAKHQGNCMQARGYHLESN